MLQQSTGDKSVVRVVLLAVVAPIRHPCCTVQATRCTFEMSPHQKTRSLGRNGDRQGKLYALHVTDRDLSRLEELGGNGRTAGMTCTTTPLFLWQEVPTGWVRS
jgi:hypothetical protein